MEFSTLGRASILFAVLLSCGSNGTGGSGTTATQNNQGGPFEAPGSSGPFAATANAAADFTAKYGSGGPFESQGASGPFVKTGDCTAACERAASFSCPPANQNQQTPAGSPGANGSANSTSLASCSQSCATLDAIQSVCLRKLIDAYVGCALTAPLSCDRNGEAQAADCPAPKTSQIAQCGGTVTPVTDQPGPNDNGGTGGNQGPPRDGGR
jgi:hypothetical protein